jgi:hypothetical protein
MENNSLKNFSLSIILATQEAEIRRIVAQSQPKQIVLKTLSQTNKQTNKQTKKPITKKGLVEWLKWYRVCLASEKP